MNNTINKIDKLLEVRGISKTFPGVNALSKVDFDLNSGEIHAIVGENGAGKSTLMKILGGVEIEDEGDIYLNGKHVILNSSYESRKYGISVVYQELSLFPNMTVAENIYPARQPVNKFNLINHRLLEEKSRELLSLLDVNISTRKLVGDLLAGEKQQIEIVKAISMDSKVLILDEPTSSLSMNEIKKLFNLLLKLKSNKVGIIYISHHLNEIFEICDRVTILRDGKKIITKDIGETNEKELATLMLGREMSEYSEGVSKSALRNKVVLELKNFSKKNNFKNINFKLYKGEILGFFGLIGSGRTELARALFGIDPFDSGEIFLNDKPVKLDNPEKAIKQSIGFVTDDRKNIGLFLSMSIKDNIVAPSLYKYTNRIGLINDSKIKATAEEYIKKLKISTPSADRDVIYLSGGNQQKVLMGQWLSTNSNILIVDEPTRGIDVGTKAEIHNLLEVLANSGVSIILISSEIPEILKISDRIAVMHKGNLINVFDNDKSDPKNMEKLLIFNASGLGSKL